LLKIPLALLSFSNLDQKQPNQNTMEHKRYKIVVFSDLKEGTKSAVLNALSLSKIVNADLEFFHIRKPKDVIESESQLSAMRTINAKHMVLEKKIKQKITKDIF